MLLAIALITRLALAFIALNVTHYRRRRRMTSCEQNAKMINCAIQAIGNAI
jgi:uncharacterized membrane protein YecN with MAPEG domain